MKIRIISKKKAMYSPFGYQQFQYDPEDSSKQNGPYVVPKDREFVYKRTTTDVRMIDDSWSPLQKYKVHPPQEMVQDPSRQERDLTTNLNNRTQTWNEDNYLDSTLEFSYNTNWEKKRVKKEKDGKD